jgi:hypothetical protein
LSEAGRNLRADRLVRYPQLALELMAAEEKADQAAKDATRYKR